MDAAVATIDGKDGIMIIDHRSNNKNKKHNMMMDLEIANDDNDDDIIAIEKRNKFEQNSGMTKRCWVWCTLAVGITVFTFIAAFRHDMIFQSSTVMEESSAEANVYKVGNSKYSHHPSVTNIENANDTAASSSDIDMSMANDDDDDDNKNNNNENEKSNHENPFQQLEKPKKEESKSEDNKKESSGGDDNDNNEDDNEEKTPFTYPDKIPNVAWIMSFGGSGTSYTIHNTESMTLYSTASNYGEEFEPAYPLFGEDAKNGPFIRSPQKPLPTKYILTKTHCGGYCMDCPPDGYIFDTTKSFLNECCTGKRKRAGGNIISVTYDSSIPKKAVHLIRNPYDNIVGRFHLGIKHKVQRSEDVYEAYAWETNYTNDATGLEHWCNYLDNEFIELELDYDVLQKYKHVPCHAEWFRYIQWHNRAIEVIEQLDLPVHRLWYDNYTTNFDQTVSGLYNFLDFEDIIGIPYEWHGTNKTYDSYFVNFAKSAAIMMKELSSNATWELIQHYVEPHLNDNNDDIDDEEEHEDEHIIDNDYNNEEDLSDKIIDYDEDATEDEDDDDKEDVDDNNEDDVDSTTTTTRSSNNKNNDPHPQVVWLMSFPNSGTSFTIGNIERTAAVATASNYAKDWTAAIPVRPELTNGPFIHRPEEDRVIPHYVMTKTHCTGYCDDCGPVHYVTSDKEFEEGCTRAEIPTGKNDGSEWKDVYYGSSVPVKAIHLFRNPFDNIVARMHLAMKKRQGLGWTDEQLEQFENSKDGLRTWCKYLDETYGKDEYEFFDEYILNRFDDLPCHADFFRYIQWHNHAVELIKKLDIPVYYLYYENYTTAFDETVDEVLNFMDLQRERKPLTFIPGKTYLNFFDDDIITRARDLIKRISTHESWELIQHYFF